MKIHCNPTRALTCAPGKLIICNLFFEPVYQVVETINDSRLNSINQLKSDETPARLILAKPRPLRIKTSTVLNGNELSTSDRATVESINFSQIGPFVTYDYIQTRLLGNKLEQPLWRTKYLIAVASAMLSISQARPETKLTSSTDFIACRLFAFAAAELLTGREVAVLQQT